MNKFSHLHLHNTYSILDGLGTAEKYCKRVVEIGQESISLTNHGNIDGLIDFQEQCKKYNLNSVLGCEAYIVDDLKVKESGEKRSHVNLLIKNSVGYRNLCKMLTIANIDGMYYRPRIDYDLLLRNCAGLVISTACVSSFIKDENGIAFFWKLYEEIGEDLYLEIMPHNKDLQKKVNKICIDLKKQQSTLKYIATNDCHYVNKEDEVAQEILLAIQRKKKWTDKDRWRFDYPGLYLTTYDEMVIAFEKQKQFKEKTYKRALRNTQKVVEKCCEFRIKERKINLPKISEDFGAHGADEELRMLCLAGVKKLFKKGKLTKIYSVRLKEELALIKKKNFSLYFLIVFDLVAWCKENNIMVGCRGSVGGSLIAYLLQITTIDPIKFNLLFSRFISEDRIGLPDIDLDFEKKKRHLAREYMEKKYGENNVAGISTFQKMKGKNALRDVARVFDISLSEVNDFCKVIEDDPMNAKDQKDELIKIAVQETNEGRRFKKKYPKIVKYAEILEGNIRSSGQHAAAVVISNSDLRKGTRGNLVVRNNTSVMNWAMEDCEKVGLVKLDLLGLNTLSILNDALLNIKKNYGKKIDIDKINLGNKKVLEEFSNGNTTGVFQFNASGVTRLCKELDIKSFLDLIAINALYRPGTLRSGLVKDYVKRNNSGRNWHTVHPIIDEITEETYGIIVYQEQVMEVANRIAGMSLREADKIRKVIAKSKGREELRRFKSKFINGCVENNTLNINQANNLFDDLEEFGGYSFNKAHSTAYAKIAYQCMFLKTFYPTEFICASLTNVEDEKKLEELVKEAYRFGLKVIPPKIGISDTAYWIAKGNCLYAPFLEIKGIGEKTVSKVLKLGEEKKNKVILKQKKIIQKGFFKSEKTVSKNRSKTKIEQILDDIKAFDLSVTHLPKNIVEKYFYFKFGLSSDYKD